MGVVSTKATGGGTTRTARLRWRYQSWPRRRPVSSITCERLSAAAAVAAAPARGQLTRPAHRRRAAIGMHEAPEMHGQVSHGLQLQSLWRTSKAGPKQYLSTVFANTVAKTTVFAANTVHGIRVFAAVFVLVYTPLRNLSTQIPESRLQLCSNQY